MLPPRPLREHIQAARPARQGYYMGCGRISPLLKVLLALGGAVIAAGAQAQGIFDSSLPSGAAASGQGLGYQGQGQGQGPQGQGTQGQGTQGQTQSIPGPLFRGDADSGLDSAYGTTVITNRPREGARVPGVVPGVVPGTEGGMAPGAGTRGREMMERPLPPPERIEFQEFVLHSTGRDLPIFGADLFRQPPSTFAPVDNIPVTPDYVVGPGDEILIRAWGQIDVDYSALVDRNGSISIPKVGVLNVAGIKYQDLPGFLKTAFGRSFRNFELTATLGRLRSIQIFVVGQAKRPGTYTLSSLSSLVTALFAVGGPSPKGSLRSIQLKRGNRVVADLDLYDLLVSGDKSHDAQLLPGDVIYIPPVGPLAAVTGSVNVPAIYELKQGEPLADLLRWAGGLSTTAEGQKVTVDRIAERRVRKVEEFPLDQAGLAHPVRDGDLVTVYALVPRFDNAVTLRGNVAQPGRFPWREGMRVRDVIPDKAALISRDYWQMRNQAVGMDPAISRLLIQQTDGTPGRKLGIDDLQLRRDADRDNPTVAQEMRQRQVEARALELLQPPKEAPDPASDPQRLLNQIRPPLKEVNWDYALIERIRPDDLRTTLVPFNLGAAVLAGDPQQNVMLQPGDVITVFSKEDIPVSTEKQTRYIRLEGEFKASGVYQILPGETLRQLVTRVGGLAPDAYLFGAEFRRESTRIQQQKNLDEELNRLEQDIQRAGISRAQNVTAPEDSAALKQQADSEAQLLARLRALHPTGRIVLGLAEDAAPRDLPDLPLEDGDRFYVPSPPSMVTVFGSVYNQNAYIYRPERHVGDYLAQAGGPTKDADKGSIYVLRADGSVMSRQQSGYFINSLDSARLMPGDSIVVPEELNKTNWMREFKDISQIFYQLGLGVAAIKVLQQ
jgi:protein involved in polysaccharide export with SLBB domain